MWYSCEEYVHGCGHGNANGSDYGYGKGYNYGYGYGDGYNYGEGFGFCPSTIVTGVKLEEVVLNAILV